MKAHYYLLDGVTKSTFGALSSGLVFSPKVAWNNQLPSQNPPFEKANQRATKLLPRFQGQFAEERKSHVVPKIMRKAHPLPSRSGLFVAPARHHQKQLEDEQETAVIARGFHSASELHYNTPVISTKASKTKNSTNKKDAAPALSHFRGAGGMTEPVDTQWRNPLLFERQITRHPSLVRLIKRESTINRACLWAFAKHLFASSKPQEALGASHQATLLIASCRRQ